MFDDDHADLRNAARGIYGGGPLPGKGPTTEQEKLWAGDFGADYTKRNLGLGRVARDIVFFAHILRRCGPITSVLELGCGDGQNLVALEQLLPEAELAGVEINEQAAMACLVGEIICGSALTFQLPDTCKPDLAFTKGLCIHVAPEDRPLLYDRLWASSSRYILLCEYYSPRSEAIAAYRGQEHALWRADFAGELMERHQDVGLVDCGFAYHRGRFPQDDLHWFLMAKLNGGTV